MIGMEAFLDSRIETEQLSGNGEGRQGHQFRGREAQQERPQESRFPATRGVSRATLPAETGSLRASENEAGV